MEVRSLGYRTDLMVRRLAGSVITDRGDCIEVRTPHNPSFYWGNFLLLPTSPGPGGLAGWLQRFASAFPAARHVAFGIDDPGGPPVPTAELEEAGVVADDGVVLTATRLVEPARPPAGTVVRPLDSDGDWAEALDLRIAVAGDEGSDSPDHRTFLARGMDEARGLSERGAATYFGAFADHHLRSFLGLVHGGGQLARFQNVETHPDHRRRGLAGALVYRAGGHGLTMPGVGTLVIVADPVGPAVGLYRSLGFAGDARHAELVRTPSP
jgi:ribosomal protein S18 acetylase RimI-like enzyme